MLVILLDVVLTVFFAFPILNQLSGGLMARFRFVVPNLSGVARNIFLVNPL